MSLSPAPPVISPKSSVRSQLRDKRQNLPDHQRDVFDTAIRQHLLQLILLRNARSVACYWPFNGEPDIKPLCAQLMQNGFRLALPVVSADDGHAMQFHAWQPDMALVANSYGIHEPPQTAPRLPVSGFDVLMMPLVGYDRLGNRLGMGAGYYDRHLETRRDKKTPLRVGVAYSLQEIEPIEKKNWDIPLHGIVNEHGWFTFT